MQLENINEKGRIISQKGERGGESERCREMRGEERYGDMEREVSNYRRSV